MANTPPPLNWPALIETFLLAGFAAMVLSKAMRGVLGYYIHPRYTPLLIAAGVVLAAMALLRMGSIYRARAAIAPGRGWSYTLLGMLLLFGTVTPAQPLGAAALDTRGIRSSAEFGSAARPRPSDSQQWNLLDWVFALGDSPPPSAGTAVLIEGFLFRSAETPAEEFMLARYVVQCCAADASAVGLPVRWQTAADLPRDQWLRVEGWLAWEERQGGLQPLVVATRVDRIDPPSDPYLYGR
ncbi:MAG: TIGR03943 family protein [Roseiflexaceae bacterium]